MRSKRSPLRTNDLTRPPVVATAKVKGARDTLNYLLFWRRRIPTLLILPSVPPLTEASSCSVPGMFGVRQDAQLVVEEEEEEQEENRWGIGSCGRFRGRTGRPRVKAVTTPHTLSSSTNPRESCQQGKVLSRHLLFFFFYPDISYLPYCFSSLLVVTQIRGHNAGAPLPSPLG